MWMWILGAALVVGGAACLSAASRTQRRVHAMMATETLSVLELEELRRISDELGARGGFRKVCEVVGQAHPAPHGLLTSELTGTPCVWHSHRIQRRYRHRSRDSRGNVEVTTRTETVAEHTSGQGFALIRDGLTIGVDPGGQRPDGVEQVTDRFEEAAPGSRPGGLMGVLDVLTGTGDDTLGYQYTEWVIRPGTPMYVLGEVHDAIGPLVIARPTDRKLPFVISTRTEEQLTHSGRTQQRWLAWTGGGLAVAGLALVPLGILL
jgi:hypothetical protein